MTENPYENGMERAWKYASDKGHELGDWKPREEGQGFVATCDRCGGKITISGEPNRILVGGLDPYMSLDFCPGNNPELMKAIDDEWTSRLADVIGYLLSRRRERMLKDQAESNMSWTKRFAQ